MMYLRDKYSGELKFIAHGPGISAPCLITNSPNLETSYTDWLSKREWCSEQGWKANTDFFSPGVTKGRWFFKTAEQQTLFAMRWS